LAAHYSFLSYTAVVAEVEVGEKGELTIPRVDIAFDCGPQVNPDRIRSQLEGAVIMGVSLATFGEITFKNGRAQQDNFNQYRVTRINEAPPDIRVHLSPTSDWSVPLGGVGEHVVRSVAVYVVPGTVDCLTVNCFTALFTPSPLPLGSSESTV
jgi:isoquinoline 1-oxidoreductase beta subunit